MRGAGELESSNPDNELTTDFAIIPQKAKISGVAAGPQCIKVTVKDQKASGITGYRVKYRVKGTDKWKTKKFPAKKSVLTVKGLEPGRKYEVKVSAYVDIPPKKRSWTLEPSYDGEASKVMTSGVVVPAPAKLKVVKQGRKSLTVTWKKQPKVTGCELRYSTSKAFKSGTRTARIAGAKKTKKIINGLTPGKRYYVQIRTYKKSGKKTYYSKWSEKKAAAVK